jgi:tetratricopeptide (TPR) repeat protein
MNNLNEYADSDLFDREIADYTEAIRLDPNDAGTYVFRGDAYSNKGDYARARADLTEALWLNPENALARDMLEEIQQKHDCKHYTEH